METKCQILAKFTYIVEQKVENVHRREFGTRPCVGKLVIENSPVKRDVNRRMESIYDSLNIDTCEDHNIESYGNFRVKGFSHTEAAILTQICIYITDVFYESGVYKQMNDELLDKIISVYKGTPWSIDISKTLDERTIEMHLMSFIEEMIEDNEVEFNQAIEKSESVEQMEAALCAVFDIVKNDVLYFIGQNSAELQKGIEKRTQKE